MGQPQAVTETSTAEVQFEVSTMCHRGQLNVRGYELPSYEEPSKPTDAALRASDRLFQDPVGSKPVFLSFLTPNVILELVRHGEKGFR